MAVSNMHIYSIPECLTDEEKFESEDDWESESSYEEQKLENLYTSLKGFPKSRLVSASCNDIIVTTKEYVRKPYHEGNIQSQISRSLLNIRELQYTDSASSEYDNANAYTNTASFNKNVKKKPPKSYLKFNDYKSNGNAAYDALLIQCPVSSPKSSHSNKAKRSQPDITSTYETLWQDFKFITQATDGLSSDRTVRNNNSESHSDISSKSNPNIENRLDSGPEKSQSSTTTIEDTHYQQCRGRSGSVQWIQNVFHNLDKKCRSFLDLRRPSDIAEEGIRSSNEELETMEHSDDESSKLGFQNASGGRRFSENVIGKQLRRIPFSSGFGHLKGLWKERSHESNKRLDVKDIDKLRPDVCPLFNFPPQKCADDDEMILDALRQAMRKCTVVDPSLRPPSSSVYQQLFQISK